MSALCNVMSHEMSLRCLGKTLLFLKSTFFLQVYIRSFSRDNVTLLLEQAIGISGNAHINRGR